VLIPLHADARALPFADEFFSAVVSIDVGARDAGRLMRWESPARRRASDSRRDEQTETTAHANRRGAP
jgi:hypothetical protein